MSPDLESEMMETTTENRRRRGYVKKRVKTARRTTEPPDGQNTPRQPRMERLVFEDTNLVQEAFHNKEEPGNDDDPSK